MKMWKKMMALVVCLMLIGTVAGSFAEDLIAAPVVEDAVDNSVKDQIMQHLKEKMAHKGDAMMTMAFDVDINLVMMGEATPIKINAEINAVSSGIEAVQIFGEAHMVSGPESQDMPLDGYLMKEDEGYTMYLRAEEGWVKQSVELGDMMNSLDEGLKDIEDNGAFVIVNEPEEQVDGLHFQAYIDLAKIIASVDQDELKEASANMMPGLDVPELLNNIAPVDVKIVCDENYDPTSILIDAKDAVQGLADAVINSVVNQMLAAMATEDGAAEGAEEMDMSQFMNLTVNTLIWNLKTIQTLPAGSVIIELPEEAKNAVDANMVSNGESIVSGSGF